jgi:hypothetical protein
MSKERKDNGGEEQELHDSSKKQQTKIRIVVLCISVPSSLVVVALVCYNLFLRMCVEWNDLGRIFHAA